MSHVVSVEFYIDDLDALGEACKSLGLELMKGQETYKWYGRWMNDYSNSDAAMNMGISPQEYGMCQHAIRVKDDTESYEVGLVRRKDGKPGYQMVYDFYGGGGQLMSKIGDNAEKLRQQYSVQQHIKRGANLQQKGFSLSQNTDDQGRVHLVYTRR
jgi:hypothetical protein